MKTTSKQFMRKAITQLGAGSLTFALASSSAFAQPSAAAKEAYPEVSALFNAFDVTQAQMFEEIAKINENPYVEEARDSLEEHLSTMANMSMQDMMAAGLMNHSGESHMGMDMTSPYGDLELEARINLRNTMQGEHSDEEAVNAFNNSTALTRHTAEIFKLGRAFENKLFSIYADNSISDKRAAVDAAVAEYKADSRHSLASTPKDVEMVITHPHANAFKTAFPRLSGFHWTQQWLQLAALEALIRADIDEQFDGGMETALERFENKIGSAGGMSMYPAPTELPMAAAIAPNLYSQSPEAAIILDNLNVLETMVADVLAYPNLENRAEAISAAIASLADKEAGQVMPEDYLLFALRGGIYNQGGPAVGELSQSERNRSRAAMDMQHTMVMGGGGGTN